MKHYISHSRQTGRTIVELMVALAIALLLLLGITAIYSSSTKGGRMATGMGAMGEDASLAVFLVGQSVKRAGYGEIVGTDFTASNQTLFDFPHLRGCKNGTFTNPATGDYTCVAGGSNDTLMVQFQSDSVLASPQRDTNNCVGSPATTQLIADVAHPSDKTNVPVVTNLFVLANEKLTCSGNNSTSLPMASNIEQFKIFYGFDSDAATAALGSKSSIAPVASTVVDADTINLLATSFAGLDKSPWDFVVSVHVCAVAKTKDKGISTQGASQTYNGCPTNTAEVLSGTGPSLTASDGAIRKTYRQVFTVRSRATQSPAVRVVP
jgi:type IV pilus assembly protein PilW